MYPSIYLAPTTTILSNLERVFSHFYCIFLIVIILFENDNDNITLHRNKFLSNVSSSTSCCLFPVCTTRCRHEKNIPICMRVRLAPTGPKSLCCLCHKDSCRHQGPYRPATKLKCPPTLWCCTDVHI